MSCKWWQWLKGSIFVQVHVCYNYSWLGYYNATRCALQPTNRCFWNQLFQHFNIFSQLFPSKVEKEEKAHKKGEIKVMLVTIFPYESWGNGKCEDRIG